MKYFPSDITTEYSVVKENNLAIQLYGKRIHESQTVGEYLLEFLLVFSGTNRGEGGLASEKNLKGKVPYVVNPNIGLKRFVFLENSKSINRYKADVTANSKLNEIIMDLIISEYFTPEQILQILKDLFYGFNLITKQRGWFAQSMIPLCRDLIFCDAMGNKSEREKLNYFDKENDCKDTISKQLDKGFGFKQHNFLARGGEMYFLHLLQGLIEFEEQTSKEDAQNMRTTLERGIFSMLDAFPQLEVLSKFIQGSWENYIEDKISNKDELQSKGTSIRDYLSEEMECEWVKESYKDIAVYAIKELRTILSSDINEFDKLEMVNIGIILNIFRIMTREAYRVSTDEKEGKPIWLIHVPSISGGDEKIKKLAVLHYNLLENYMTTAIYKQHEIRSLLVEGKMTKEEIIKDLRNAYDDSHKLLRKIGKEIGLIIPPTGASMRFSMSDSIVRYLVISMVEPMTSITLDRFMEKIYNYYGIVIREKEFTNHENLIDGQEIYAPYLKYNFESFTIQLKANGFLKELSDATAIVSNPYEKTEDI